MTKDELANKEPIERLQWREYERQQFLDELKRHINMLEPVLTEGDPRLFRRLTLGTLAVFLGREVALEAWPENQPAYSRIFASLPEAAQLFKNILMPKIELFTRSAVEKNLLIVDLLEYVISSFTQDIRSEFLRVTIHGRKEFFKTIGYPTDGCN